MALNEIETNVVELFVAAYGRVPTQNGVDFFSQKVASGEMTYKDILAYMVDTEHNPEAAQRFSTDKPTKDKVISVFEHILGREPATEEGLNYWVDRIDNEEGYTLSDFIFDFLNSAKNADGDKDVLANKLDVAEHFLDTVPRDIQKDNIVYTDDVITRKDTLEKKLEIDESQGDNSDMKSVVSGDVWEKNVITYSFNEDIPDSYYELDSTNYNYTEDFQPLTTQQRDATREIFSDLGNYVDVEFKEVDNNGDVRLNMVDTGNAAGYAFYPGEEPDYLGDVFLSKEFVNPDTDYDYTLEEGRYGWSVIEHEVGHSLGLEHTFEGERVISSDKNYSAYSVMSYTSKHNNKLEYNKTDDGGVYLKTLAMEPEAYSLYDVEALQYMYGKNENYHTGNDTYSYDFESSNFHTIWDAGGTDTLNLSSTKGKNTIDLRGGTLNSVDEYSLEQLIEYYQDQLDDDLYDDWVEDTVTDYYNKDILYTGKDNLGIVSGVVIENVYTGSGDDSITDNSADNIIRTSSGNDSIYIGNGGNDYINGGDGFDKVYVNTDLSSLDIEKDGSLYYVEDSENSFSATLENVEQIVDITGSVYDLA